VDQSQIVEAAEQIEQVLGEEAVNRLGREVGFAHRLRLLTPFRLVAALVGAFGGQTVNCIADLVRAFNAVFDTAVAYKPFHNQLAKRHFAHFMRAVAQRAWSHWVVQVLGAPPSQLFGEFRRIVIQDGSSFAVKDSLRHLWPGRFTTSHPAAVELHAT
jgi:hypothetical protein